MRGDAAAGARAHQTQQFARGPADRVRDRTACSPMRAEAASIRGLSRRSRSSADKSCSTKGNVGAAPRCERLTVAAQAARNASWRSTHALQRRRSAATSSAPREVQRHRLVVGQRCLRLEPGGKPDLALRLRCRHHPCERRIGERIVVDRHGPAPGRSVAHALTLMYLPGASGLGTNHAGSPSAILAQARTGDRRLGRHRTHVSPASRRRGRNSASCNSSDRFPERLRDAQRNPPRCAPW